MRIYWRPALELIRAACAAGAPAPANVALGEACRGPGDERSAVDIGSLAVLNLINAGLIAREKAGTAHNRRIFVDRASGARTAASASASCGGMAPSQAACERAALKLPLAKEPPGPVERALAALGPRARRIPGRDQGSETLALDGRACAARALVAEANRAGARIFYPGVMPRRRADGD